MSPVAEGDALILNANRVAVAWTPETDADHRLVQQELSAILSSHHFRNSKRYPALLRYVVEKSLDGQIDQLKERTLGVEVFGRRPDYDTNADPVVRFTAGEIRKKIAQYYQEGNGLSEVQICLPLGSYVPEFTTWLPVSEPRGEETGAIEEGKPTHQARIFPAPQTVQNLQVQDPRVLNPSAVPRPAAKNWTTRFLLIVSCLAALVISASGYLIYRVSRPSPTDQLWASLLRPAGPVLIVVSGRSHELTAPEPAQTSLFAHMIGPYHHVSVSTAIALARLAAVLQQHNKDYTVKEASVTSLSDLRQRSIILVGALNNDWTLRLIQPLRYRFIQGPLARIEDTKNPGNHDWTVDFSQAFTSVTHDYAIVARYHDPTTNGSLMIIAGLGPYGTEAASEFVSTPQYIEQISLQIPDGLKNRNLEMVIRTDIIAGEAGPPHLIASSTF